MDLLAAVSAAARTHASALMAEAARATAWCAALATLALTALGLLTAGAVVALAERLGTAEALGVAGTALAFVALVVYALLQRRGRSEPIQKGSVFAPSILRQDVTVDPKFPGGLAVLTLLAGASYFLGRRRL